MEVGQQSLECLCRKNEYHQETM